MRNCCKADLARAIQQGAISPVKASTWSLRGRADPGRGVARRRQPLRTTRLTRRIQRFDSRAISLFVRMVIVLGHRQRLVAGEVVDLLDRDAKVQHSCDEEMVEVAV